MGTASTMACITAALGLIPVQGAFAPAVSAARIRIAEQTGANAVAAAQNRRTPQTILSAESFYNAAIVLQAIGGSTNAMVHLIAIVNRHPGVKGLININTLDDVGRRTPLLVDLKPSGDNYMNDFHNAGGMLCLLHRLRPLLHLSAKTITGETLGEFLDRNAFRDFEYSLSIIRTLSDPLHVSSSLIVVEGNIAPNGAVMKASASKDKRLLRHTGPAVVFENSSDLASRLDDSDLDVTADSVLVLKGIGPIGHPGMPEAGMIPIPRKLAARGVADMLRISDGRMSGTAGETIVLHISPESAIPGSPFGIIRSGDLIVFDAEKRVLRVDISDEELQARIEQRRREIVDTSQSWKERQTRRGYRGLYERTVNQAHEGADFDFLTAMGVA